MTELLNERRASDYINEMTNWQRKQWHAAGRPLTEDGMLRVLIRTRRGTQDEAEVKRRVLARTLRRLDSEETLRNREPFYVRAARLNVHAFKGHIKYWFTEWLKARALRRQQRASRKANRRK